MCDSAAPGTRTGSGARHSVPVCARPAAHARACQSSFEQAGAGRTPICAPARRSLARSARARLSTLVACVHDTALLIASLPGSPIVGMGSPFAFVKPGQEARHLCQGSLYIIDRDCPICKNWSTFPRRSRRPGCPGDQELGTRTHRRRRLTCRAATPCGSTLINCSFCLTSQAQWSAVSVKLLPCHRPPTCAQLVKGCPVCPASDRTPPLPSRPRTPWDQDDAPAGLGLAEASHAGTRRVSVRPVLPDALDYGLQRLPGRQVPARLAEIGGRERVGVRVEQHRTPFSRRNATLRANARCLASVMFGLGTAAIGCPAASPSLSSPRARVSLMPFAHLLIVLNVAGATTNASGGNGRTSGSSAACSRRGRGGRSGRQAGPRRRTEFRRAW